MANEVISIDLSNYKDRFGERVDEGRYRVVVDDVEQDQSKAGNVMINIWYRVVGGEFDGSTIIDRLTITEKAMFRVVGFLNAIGLPTPRKRLQLNIRSWVGKQLEIDIEDGEPYNGRVKSEVRGYLKIKGKVASVSTSADSNDFGGEFDDLDALEDSVAEAPADTAVNVADTSGMDDNGEVDLDEVDL